jgi:hypothetical protein
MRQLVGKIKAIVDYLGGAADEPQDESLRWPKSPIFQGLWWAILMLLILAFCGQTSRFIYIDF